MRYVMGVDVGTASAKALALDERGRAAAPAARAYRFREPAPGRAEQDPDDWYEACAGAIREALSGLEGGGARVEAVSLSGQMHGLVALDADFRPLRPAILHCDARSGAEAARLAAGGGARYNRPYTGFLLPSLLWVAEHEPHIFEQIRHVCLPKDYVRLRLCGEFCTDYSDASGTLAFDVAAFRWAEEGPAALGIPAAWFPPCRESAEPAGTVSARAAAETGLRPGTLCAAGGADQAMQAVGAGATRPGQATVNIGSSAQVCFQAAEPVDGAARAVNTFCGFRRGRWFTMGATMSAGLSLGWFAREIAGKGFKELDEAASRAPEGSGGALFLPFLNGERTPYCEPGLRGAFFGLGFSSKQGHLARAVMEGVAFSLRHCAEICGELGLKAGEYIASGGGARSPVWLGIQADVYGVPLKLTECAEQAAAGAAITAAAAAGWYPSVEDAADAMARYRPERREPDAARHARYGEYYRRYREAADALYMFARRNG